MSEQSKSCLLWAGLDVTIKGGVCMCVHVRTPIPTSRVGLAAIGETTEKCNGKIK